MQSQWLHLQKVLKGDKKSIIGITEPFFLRLIQIINDPNANTLDKCKAYQDALRCASSHGISEVALHLPEPIFPEHILLKFGLSQELALGRIFLVETNLSATEKDVYRRTRRRHLKEVKLDISLFIALNNDAYNNYNGLGQQTAIRAVLTSPEDSTIIINLPTGSGKTLAIHALMLKTPINLLTLVIVPTIGLAIEQAQRAKSILKDVEQDHGGVYAWYGEQSIVEQRQVKERLINSSQRVLFCAPESALGTLLPILLKVAKNGQIGAVVVDEAHIVTQAGGYFRPEFQLISPLMNALQSVSGQGIRKILMSATFNSYTLTMLRNLFAPLDKKIIEINGSFLRPEPSYHLINTSINMHQDTVLKAVFHLPRPLILYTTKVKAGSSEPMDWGAIEWYEKLKNEGFNRIGLIHGDTSPSSRERIINDWRDGKIDIMVATSAFGVGMDKADLRSVLHATVPENLDRFYQEAGRGGRDGNASLSYLIYHDDQLRTAKKINEEKLIGTELGLEHWLQMFRSTEANEKQFYTVDLTVKRLGLAYNSEENLSWNWRTLLLMQRSGFIRLHYRHHETPEENSTGTIEMHQRNLEGYFNKIDVEILDDGHRNRAHWETKIGAHREYEKSERARGFNELAKWILNPKTSLCTVLQSYYADDGRSPELACGGCPGCRLKGMEYFTPTLGLSKSVKEWPLENSKNNLMPMSQSIKVYYSEVKNPSALVSNWKSWIHSLLKSHTISAIRGRRDVLELIEAMLPAGSNYFWCSLDISEENLLWNELTLVMPDELNVQKVNTGENIRIIVAPTELRHTELPHRRWWEVNSNSKSVSLENFARQILNVNNK